MAQAAVLPKRPDAGFTSPVMRSAASSDAAALATLWELARPAQAPSAKELLNMLHVGRALLLEGEGGELLAALHYQEEAGGWRVTPIVTHPDHRGQGFGRWLMTTLEADAIRGNVPFLLLTLPDDTTLAYYSRLGYRAQGDNELELSKRVGGMWQQMELTV